MDRKNTYNIVGRHSEVPILIKEKELENDIQQMIKDIEKIIADVQKRINDLQNTKELVLVNAQQVNQRGKFIYDKMHELEVKMGRLRVYENPEYQHLCQELNDIKLRLAVAENNDAETELAVCENDMVVYKDILGIYRKLLQGMPPNILTDKAQLN